MANSFLFDHSLHINSRVLNVAVLHVDGNTRSSKEPPAAHVLNQFGKLGLGLIAPVQVTRESVCSHDACDFSTSRARLHSLFLATLSVIPRFAEESGFRASARGHPDPSADLGMT